MRAEQRFGLGKAVRSHATADLADRSGAARLDPLRQPLDQVPQMLRAVRQQCRCGLDHVGAGEQVFDDLFGSVDASAAGEA
jgi:hypothetical protein